MAAEPQSPPSQAQSFVVKGQYIKDLSFENPHAPHSLIATGNKPAIDVNVDLKAEALQEGVYEMTLHLAARAVSDGNTLFLVDLAYAGIFQISNVPAERLEPLIMTDCPFVLFPFARRVIADVTRDGGFPPLMLDPVDFHALYLQNRARMKM
ncbi:MAG: protein-export chaperone SecB [Pseudomonadota bacterium]|nr:protein-export chaperone SecB [Pseudomonadota bacterium]MDE3037338.1 protein-export chaperone SecB [Pseudomonadota bacterium]